MDRLLTALSQAEGPFLLWVQETVRNAVLDPVVAFYTQLGNAGLLWIVLCGLMLLFPKTRKAGIAGAVGLVFSLLFTNILIKHLVNRTRPWLVLEGLVPLVVERDPNSFPSGHTSAAFAAAAAWYPTLPRKWMGAAGLALAALMGLSRLYVGVHFPSDVLCGFLVGTLCGELAWWLCRKWEERREAPRS